MPWQDTPIEYACSILLTCLAGGQRGLPNVTGHLCWLSSSIQALSHVEPWLLFFQDRLLEQSEKAVLHTPIAASVEECGNSNKDGPTMSASQLLILTNCFCQCFSFRPSLLAAFLTVQAPSSAKNGDANYHSATKKC